MTININQPPEAHIQVSDSLQIELFATDAQFKLQDKETSAVYGVGVGGSIIGEPVIHEDRVYVACCDKHVYAIDLESGKEVWRFAGKDVMWDLCIYKDRLYVTSYDGSLYALTLTGELIWTFHQQGKLASKPWVTEDTVYVGGKDGLFAVTRETGELLWHFSDSSPCGADPIMHNGVVYAGFHSGNCYAFHPDGSQVWTHTVKGPVGTATPFHNVILFPSWDGTVYALNTTGGLEWSFTTSYRLWLTQLPVKDDMFFIPTSGQAVYAVDKNGNQIWKIPTEGVPGFHAIADNLLHFCTIDGVITGVDLHTGDTVYEYRLDAKPLGVAVQGDQLIYNCYDCKLLSLNQAGDILWTFPTSLSYISPLNWETVSPQIVITEQLKSQALEKHKEPYTTKIQEHVEDGVYNSLNVAYQSLNHYVKKSRYGSF